MLTSIKIKRQNLEKDYAYASGYASSFPPNTLVVQSGSNGQFGIKNNNLLISNLKTDIL